MVFYKLLQWLQCSQKWESLRTAEHWLQQQL